MKKYSELTNEEKDKLLKKAKRVGIATGVSGLATALAGKMAEDPKFKNYFEKKGYDLTKGSKLAKYIGTGTGLAGLGAYGVAKYKHHKLKKQDDNSKK